MRRWAQHRVDTPGSPSPAGGANTCDHLHHDPGTQGATGTEERQQQSQGDPCRFYYVERETGLFTVFMILVVVVGCCQYLLSLSTKS